MCPEDVTSHLEEEPLDPGAGLDDNSPTYQDVSPGYQDVSPGYQDVSPGYQDVSPGYQRRSAPQRSVSESELSRVRTQCLFWSLGQKYYGLYSFARSSAWLSSRWARCDVSFQSCSISPFCPGLHLLCRSSLETVCSQKNSRLDVIHTSPTSLPGGTRSD